MTMTTEPTTTDPTRQTFTFVEDPTELLRLRGIVDQIRGDLGRVKADAEGVIERSKAARLDFEMQARRAVEQVGAWQESTGDDDDDLTDAVRIIVRAVGGWAHLYVDLVDFSEAISPDTWSSLETEGSE